MQYLIELIEKKQQLSFKELENKPQIVKEIKQCLCRGGYLSEDSNKEKNNDKVFKALNDFKKQRFLAYLDTIGPSTATMLLQLNTAESKKLNKEDITFASSLLGVESAVIKAVIEVEATGEGFLPDGRPKILFEAHLFSKETKAVYDFSHPNISSPHWNRALYKGGVKEWDRFNIAAKLNRNAAIRSTSFGAFQILGSNAIAIGYKSEEEFFLKMHESAKEHLLAFCGFVKANGLIDELKQKRWADFARRYNGPGYRANAYDEKLAASYKKFV